MCEEKNGNGRKLTPKQEMFVREYLIDLNATAACVRAGYSSRTADKIGPELLGKTSVQAEIQRLRAKREQKTEITAERVLTEIHRLAFLDIRQAFDENGRLKDIHDIPEDVARAIAGIECVELDSSKGYLKKIKLVSKEKALEMLGRHLSLFVDRQEISGPGGGPVQIRAEITQMTDEELDAELARLTTGDTGSGG